jgi:large subunit ribosomal protein L24
MGQHKLRIKTDDTVIVIAGKDKGKTGKVLRVDPKNSKVFVEGLNMVKRHQRPVQGRPNMQVGVIEKEGGIHVSNVALYDAKTKKPTRVSVVRRDDGRRIRVTKRSGTELD